MRVVALFVAIALALSRADATGTATATAIGTGESRDDKLFGREIPIQSKAKADDAGIAPAPAMTHAQVLQPVGQSSAAAPALQQPAITQPQVIANNPNAFVGDPRALAPNTVPGTAATTLPGTVAPGSAVGAVLAVNDGDGVEQRPMAAPIAQQTSTPLSAEPVSMQSSQSSQSQGQLKQRVQMLPLLTDKPLKEGDRFELRKVSDAKASASEGSHHGGGFGVGIGFVLVPVVPVAPVVPVRPAPIVAAAPLLAVGGIGGGFGHGHGHF